MMDLSRSSGYLPLPLQIGYACQPLLQTERVYTLVAAALPDGIGRQRPVLGLRRHLPQGGPVQHGQAGASGRQALIRPFVLRANLGDRIHVQVTNLLAHMPLDLALVDDDFGIAEAGDGPALVHGESHTYTWSCRHAGVYPMYNRACPDPVERRSLLGVLIVEP